MSTISLVHEGNISIEHLASMSTTALAVQMIVKAKGSKRYADMVGDRKMRIAKKGTNGRRANRRNSGSYEVGYAEKIFTGYKVNWRGHTAARCDDSWCCPERKDRITEGDLRRIALFDDFEPWMPEAPVHCKSRRYSLTRWVGAEVWADDHYGQVLHWEQDEWGQDSTIKGYGLIAPPVVPDAPVVSRWEIEEFKEQQESARRNADWAAERAAKEAARKAKAEAKRQKTLERQRQYWAKVYQRPEAEQAAKRSLSTNAVLSTATK